MKILVPALKQLLIQSKMASLKISNIYVGPYQIYVKIERLTDLPTTNSSDYEVTIGIFNTLTAPPFKLPKLTPEEMMLFPISKLFDGAKRRVTESEVLLENVREAIIQKVKYFTTLNLEKDATLLYSTANTPEENAALAKNNPNNQEAREEWYRTTYGLTKDQIADLHMFHSPYQVPAGYTYEELKLCIMLLPFRRQHMELSRNIMPETLKEELFVQMNEPISRTTLLRDAIFDMFIDLNRQPPPMCES